MILLAQWLGQADFVLQIANCPRSTSHILIDSYLSNSLAHKYSGTLFPKHGGWMDLTALVVIGRRTRSLGDAR
jgi:hypothetical protein